MKSCAHICSIDWVASKLVKHSELDQFLAVYYVSMKAYRKSMGFKNGISKRKLLKKFIKTGKVFKHCPLCGMALDYKEFY